MSASKILKLFLVSVLFLSVTSLFADLEVSFEDVNEFRDFTINGLFNQEQARDLFEKQIQSFWKRRMKDLLPEGSALELNFSDIDMAGEMRPFPQSGQSHTRVVSDRFPPNLKFDFKLLSDEGGVLAEGSEDLRGKDYTFRNRRSPAPGEATFFHELEMLFAWLENLELPDSMSTREGS